MSERLRLALVGCGRIAHKHLRGVAASERYALVAAADPIVERARELTAAHGGRAFASAQELLAGTECDLVAVCAPSSRHVELGALAAAAGRHVLTEKPLALSVADGAGLVESCAAAGVELFVVKQLRFSAAARALKRAVELGRFGRIFLATASVLWQRPQQYFDQEPWRGTLADDGGLFLNQAEHYVDLLAWLLGRHADVVGRAATLGRRIEMEDTAAAVITFASGALGALQATVLAYPRNIEGTLSVFGERGTVRLGGRGLTQVERWEFAEYHDDDELMGEAAAGRVNLELPTHREVYLAAAETIADGAPNAIGGRDDLATLELAVALERAFRPDGGAQ